MRRPSPERDAAIVSAYVKGEYTTEHIARRFGLSRSQVARIARRHGVGRTRAEANRVAAPLKSRRRIRTS